MAAEVTQAVPTDRYQIRETALGYIAETAPLSSCPSGIALAAQALRGTSLGLRAGDVVTNIVVCVNVAAAGGSGVVNVGLYSSVYGKLAASGDVGASFGATGQIPLALSAPFTITASDLYYAVIDMTTAYVTTQPSLVGAGATGGSGALSGKPKPFWLQGAQASLPATATPTDTGAAVWFAVS